ncbi:MAG: type II toxin-antitoxin system RelE/ParE family toxin [Clostridiales bacterium]|jgi:plasmid stabilization system protein ParE|nr:type II toxin-antitoxin system RelE/ParE family toxin [Clostridiales bacterium]
MTCKKRIARAAHEDIAGIRDYIKKDKPAAADRIAKAIYASFDFLCGNPYAGGELANKFGIESDYRFWVVKPYIVVYKIEDGYIGVYRVLDGRSDYLAALNLLNTPKEDGEE